MLLQIKIYLIAVLYFFGVLFMILFPPRNYAMSGTRKRPVRSTNESSTFAEYLNPNSLLSAFESIAKNRKEVANIIHLTPTTFENRTLIALELRSDKQSSKPGILVIGGLNAMTWAAPSAILILAGRLLYDSSYQTPFFNDYDWYIIPMGNPDGIYFTQQLRKLQPMDANEWSKNKTARISTRPTEWFKNVDRDSNEDDACFGTNINRNFAFHWQDDVRVQPDKCSQLYAGPKPFSTAEARAIRSYVDRLGESVQLVIHLHASYEPKKEYILYPWRYSLRQPSNYKTLQEIGEYAARHARLPDGRIYEVHQSSNDGKAAGSFSDYVCGVAGVDLVYVIKPYHEKYPNFTQINPIDVYVKKSLNTILGLVRGWRSSTKVNTLSFFGKDVEF